MVRICVLGAGIIGMSQACVLQEKLPNAEVTVIAEKFSPELTSDVAAGWWHPYLLGEEDQEKLERWCRVTYAYIQRFARSHPTYGAMETCGYQFNKMREPRPYFADIVEHFQELTVDEISAQRPGNSEKVEQGWFFKTLVLEPTKHLEYLTHLFKRRGGMIREQKLESIQHIGNSFDVVVNCTGLGSRWLFGDKTVHPIRGQIVRVRCPPVKNFCLEETTYCLVNSDCIILGGTAEVDDWDLTVRPKTAQDILERTAKLVPALKDAEILSHHVGLRPARPSVRLEREYCEVEGKMIPIIHNYGHGGSGVTLFQGCAEDGARLVLEEIRKSKL